MKFQLSIIASSILMLSACGGGSSNSTEPVNQSAATQTQNTQTEPNFSDDDFQVSFFSKNSCSETPTQSTVVFHQEDGVVLHEVDSPENGVLNTRWPTDTHHITFIRSSTDENGAQLKDVITWANVEQYDLFSKVVFQDDSACDCQEQTFNFSSLNTSNPTYFVSGLNTPRQSVSELDEVQVCFNGLHKAIFIDDGAYSDVRAASFELNTGSVSPQDSDFTLAGNKIELPDSVAKTNTKVRHYSNDNLVLTQDGQSHLFNFDALPGSAMVEVNNSLSEDLDFGYNVTVRNTHSLSEQATIDGLKLVSLDSELQEQILAFSSSATSSVTPAFQFSTFDERMDAIMFYVSWKDSENGTVRWKINAQPTAQLPDFWLGSTVRQGVSGASGNGSYLELHATNFSGSYVEYIKYLHQAEFTQEMAIKDKFYDDSAFIKIENILNYNVN